jgi:hypothetical protein
MGTATTTSAFLTWFSEWGQVAYVGLQVAFWIAIAAAALIIALQYKKFVSYKVGRAVKPADEAVVESADEVEVLAE